MKFELRIVSENQEQRLVMGLVVELWMSMLRARLSMSRWRYRKAEIYLQVEANA